MVRRAYVKIEDIRNNIYKMKQVCSLLKVTPRTLRYYEQLGLLPSTKRSRGKIRLYTQKEIEIIKEIKKLQKKGYQLSKIKDILEKQGKINKEAAKLKIFIDSTFSIPFELANKHNIDIIPMNINFGVDSYQDLTTLAPERFYALETKKRVLATSSPPSIEEYTEIFKKAFVEGGKEIVSLHADSRFAGSYKNAKAAAKELTTLKITVIDTKLIGLSFKNIFDEIVKTKNITAAKIKKIVAVTTKDLSELIIINSQERFKKESDNDLANILTSFTPVLQHTAKSGLVPLGRFNSKEEALAFVIKIVKGKFKTFIEGYSHSANKNMFKTLKIKESYNYSSVLMSNLGRDLIGLGLKK